MADAPSRSTSQQALLLRVVEDLAEIKAEIKADRSYRERIEQRIEDHEVRVRELERARWASAWITAVSSAALTALVVAGINTTIGA